MNPKLVKTEHAHYVAEEWSGKNTSGLEPIGDAILVLTDAASKTLGSKGLLVAPEELTDRHSEAATSGLVIAVGDGAFAWNSDRSRPYMGEKIKPGDRVYFARYSGQKHTGKDGRTYRLMSDNCVAGVECD